MMWGTVITIDHGGLTTTHSNVAEPPSRWVSRWQRTDIGKVGPNLPANRWMSVICISPLREWEGGILRTSCGDDARGRCREHPLSGYSALWRDEKCSMVYPEGLFLMERREEPGRRRQSSHGSPPQGPVSLVLFFRIAWYNRLSAYTCIDSWALQFCCKIPYRMGRRPVNDHIPQRVLRSADISAAPIQCGARGREFGVARVMYTRM